MNKYLNPVSSIRFKDTENKPILKVSVHLENRTGVTLFKGKTNPVSGILVLPKIKAGKYKMTAKAKGCQPLVTGIEITGKQENELYYIGTEKDTCIYFGGKKMFLKKKPSEVGVVFTDKKPATRTINKLIPKDKRKYMVEFGQYEGFSKKVKLTTKAAQRSIAKALVSSEKVIFSGLVIDTPAGEAIPTGEIFVQLFADADKGQFLNTLSKNFPDFKWIKTFRIVDEFIVLQYIGDQGKLFEKTRLLDAMDDIFVLDFGLYFGEGTPGQVFPGDSLRQGQYHLIVTGMPQAWQILSNNGFNAGGSADVIIAFPDEGIQTTGGGGAISHPDFNTNIAGGNLTGQLTSPNPARKIYCTVDYRTGGAFTITNNNDNVVGNHGTQIAGAAAAFSDGASGVVGVASNTRIVGVIEPTTLGNTFIRIVEAYQHLTGFDPVWTPAQYAVGQRFPRNFRTPGLLSNHNANATLAIPDGPAPDVLSLSWSNVGYLNATVRAVFNQSAKLGRNRRGTLQIGLAQNRCRPYREAVNNNSWGPDSSFIVIAASGLDHLGRETKAGYSNYAIDLTPGIDVCAPSGTAMGGAVAPPLTKGVLTTTLNGTGTTTDTIVDTRVLTADANVGDTSLSASTAGVPFASIHALLQRVNNPHVFEWILFVPPLAGGTYNLRHPIRNSYTSVAGDRIVLFSNTAANKHWNLFFDGTSAATPVIGGLAALMITINPALTWLDVRRILRQTAVPIDIKHRGPRPQNIPNPANAAAPNYTDSAVPANVIHATDFNWFEFNPATPQNMATANPLLDANGQLDLNGNASIMSAVAPIYPADNNSFQQYFINIGPPPGGAPRFQKRQALLIGAETMLNTAVPHPGPGPDTGGTNFILVNNANGFNAGDNIIVGRNTQTILQITPSAPAGVATIFLDVLSTDGFQIGDLIRIPLAAGAVVRIINNFGTNAPANDGLTGSSTRIILNANITTAAGDNGIIIQIDPASWEQATVLNTAANRINLTANLANAYNPANNIIVKNATHELRVVKDVQIVGGNERLEVDKFDHVHTAAVRVTGGRIANYSFIYGYGRVDGPAAVTAALNYFTTAQAVTVPPVVLENQYSDVHIRNTLADIGAAATAVVDSPDIWLRKANDMLAALPAMGDPGPHEQITPEFRFTGYAGTVAHNDLIIHGDFTPGARAIYTITNDGAGNFSWTKDAAAAGGPIAITPNAMQVVMDGLLIMFGSTAYDGTEIWTITGTPVSRNCFIRVKNRGLMGTFVPNNMPAGAGPAMPAIPDFYQVRFFIHLTNGSPIIRYQNTAAGGQDDIEIRGTYNQATIGTFTILIDGTAGGAVADTFSHQNNAGAVTSGVSITGGWQNIGNGIDIRFRATQGHLGTDRWQLFARPNAGTERFHSLDDFVIANPTQNPFNFELDRAGTHLLSTVNFSQSIDNGVVGFNPSLAFNQTRLFHTTWAENLLPVRKGSFALAPAAPLRMFLMAECVPHDGPLIGNTPANNNNLSYRELLFAHFNFRDGGGADLASFIEVDGLGSISNETIEIELISDSVSFRTESLEIELEMELTNNTFETKIFKNLTGVWQFVGGAPVWAGGNNPVIGTSALAATNDQYQIRISIDLQLTNAYVRLKIIPKIYSALQATVVLASDEKILPIYAQALLPSQRFTGGAKADLIPKSHFFTEPAKITQTVVEAYGPVAGSEINKFRVTSLFKRSGGADPKAYAPIRSTVVVQRDPTNNNVVNLILKPFRQPMLGFTPIKYFIYRGIKLTEYLKGTSATHEKLVRDLVGANAFVTRQWGNHTALNPGAAPFDSKSFGYDPDNQIGGDLIDDVFFREDASFQLPMALKGEHIGEFFTDEGTDTFGFEIILEEGEFQPDLSYVRKTSHEVDVTILPTGTDTEKFTMALKREEILNFLDPAAFYGMHRSDKGEIKATEAGAESTYSPDDIYANILQKFHTKNKLYIDVRNENGQSYNFYGQYDDGSGNAIGVGLTSGSIVNQPYQKASWPILIIDRVSATNANAFDEIFIQLQKNYNKKPILYQEHARATTAITKGRFIADAELGTGANNTDAIGFRFPNNDEGGGNKIGTAWLLKMHYGMQLDAANDPFPNVVPPTKKYIDNLFGPLNLKLNWKGDFKFAWHAAQDKKFVDASSSGYSQVVNRGLAIEDKVGPTDRILFYANAKDSFANTNTEFVPHKGLTGGVSKRDDFFDEKHLTDGFKLSYDLIKDGATEIKSLALAPDTIYPRPLESLLMLGLGKTEYTDLVGLAGLNNSYPRNIHLEEIAGSPFTIDGKTYKKFKTGIRGLKNDGTHDTVYPAVADTIHVYSIDDLFFFSKKFADNQPIPTEYTRNYEEALGKADRLPRNYVILSVTATSIKIQGKDLRYDIIVGDKVVIKTSKHNDGNYEVASVVWDGSDSIINVTLVGGAAAALNPVSTLGDLHEVSKPYEDYFIAKDIKGALGGSQQMSSIVSDFETAVDAATDDAAGVVALTAAVNDAATKIWNRGRELCFDNTYDYADDRVLYWARIKMLVKLKGHAQVLKSLGERNKLVKLFEDKSRGIDGFSIAGAGKKVIIVGADPFYLGKNILYHNPAGSVALASSGRPLIINKTGGGTESFKVESVVLPVRYEDLDRDGSGSGLVEELFKKYVNSGDGSYQAVDMVLCLWRNNDRKMAVNKFAVRKRGGVSDNVNLPSPAQNPAFKIDPLLIGNDFYETSLDKTKIIPATNPDDHGFDVIEDTDAKDVGAPKDNYIGNEIMYRLMRMKPSADNSVITGMISLPKVQEDTGDFVAADNKSVIEAILKEIANHIA